MNMSAEYPRFADILQKKPLIFTVVPVRDNKTGDTLHDEKILRSVNARKDEIVSMLKPFKRLNAINVPELVEENHEGKPRYNSVYTRKLARSIADSIGVDAIVNKVVVHIESYEEYVKWIAETSSLGISNIIFVGGNTRHHRYPGPSVSEANITIKHLEERSQINGITVGNICLPERSGEAKKMLYKTMTGAKFFTTQMLFDGRQIAEVLNEYGKLCSTARIEPSTVLLSFAPLKSTADLNLLDFLGVDLPESTKNFILEDVSMTESTHRSLLNALNVYSSVTEALENMDYKVPIGVNIEQLTKSNLPSSVRMLDEFSKVIDLGNVEIKKRISMLQESG
ncbi:MAG: hypothetical protein AAE977_06235 [Thermoplasmataceae archaeon]|jgi:hypothetical protein